MIYGKPLEIPSPGPPKAKGIFRQDRLDSLVTRYVEEIRALDVNVWKCLSHFYGVRCIAPVSLCWLNWQRVFS